MLGLLFGPVVYAQKRVDPRNLYERVYAIVPVTGAGTYADPKRPLFVPSPSQIKAGDRSGVIGWHYELSDNGQLAIVELVYADKAAAAGLSSTLKTVPLVSAFQKGKDDSAQIESSCRAVKQGFKLDQFAMKVQQ